MRFIDLFAGLGGFHLALSKLGHTCVFASEVDPTLRELYETNFGVSAAGDIRKVKAARIPQHDIICAGFPCQPFSKAGRQQGLQEPESGSLFFQIIRIIKRHRPPFLLLENVPHFARHDGGQTWTRVESELRKKGYDVRIAKLSPHVFGIPQIRERIYIVGSQYGLHDFAWPSPTHQSVSITSVLDTNPPDGKPIPEQVARCLRVWQKFLDLFPPDERLPSFPIWSMEFGATYPYEETTPWALPQEALKQFLGSHGRPVVGESKEEMLKCLPSHARTAQDKFPHWKQLFIRQNRELYERNKSWVGAWMPAILEFPSSFQKLEWNCQGEPRDLTRFVIQIRASGVRIKRPTTAPSLVAMTATQVPIIGWESRYMTPTECKRLQSMDGLILPDNPTRAYEALGNAVNVEVARRVAKALLGGRRRASSSVSGSNGEQWTAQPQLEGVRC